MKTLPLVLTMLTIVSAPRMLAQNDGAWLAKAKAEYPVKKCVVSDEQVGGSMGPGIDYVYRHDGQPDRLVRFCCKDCRKDFEKEPANT